MRKIMVALIVAMLFTGPVYAQAQTATEEVMVSVSGCCFTMLEDGSIVRVPPSFYGLADPPADAVPAITFADASTPSVPVPELAILHRFPHHIFGRQLASLVNPSLQRVTAWGAAAMLRAIRIPAVQRGVHVDLSSMSLEVQEWCSGLVSMKWLLLLALFIALVGSGSVPWKVALVLAAPLIALEANMLRVAAYGVGLELGGYDYRHLLKDGTGWATLALGVVQVIGLGWLVNRRARTA